MCFLFWISEKRKRESCDTYQASSLTKLPVVLKIFRHKVKVNNPRKLSIDHLQRSQCKSRACVSCIVFVCMAIKANNDHINDQWYNSVQNDVTKDEYLRKFKGHCCEIGKRIKKCRSTTSIYSVSHVPLGLHYDGYLHLPQI